MHHAHATAPVALVTGAARRIGAAITRHLTLKGWRVLAHWHQSREDMDTLARECHGRVETLRADLATAEGRCQLAEQVLGRVKDEGLDLVVHNASHFPHARLADVDDALFDTLFTLHVKTPLLLSRDLAPALSRRSGMVLNLLDAGAPLQWPGYLPYALSKQALKDATIALARELAPAVRVNGIAPGFILPPENAPDSYRHAEALRLTQAVGGPAEILRALDYLLDSPFVTGEILTVDGGRRWIRPLASNAPAAPSACEELRRVSGGPAPRPQVPPSLSRA